MSTTKPSDMSRLRTTVDFVEQNDTTALLPLLLPSLDDPDLRALTQYCRFTHAALLLFPADPHAMRAVLAECGLTADAPQPSVVVRERLASRHRRAADRLNVDIWRPSVTGQDGVQRIVEVFALTVASGSDLESVAEVERRLDQEAHVGFEINRPDPLVLRGVRGTLARYGAIPDGGGYNPHENGTVFYFAAPADAKSEYRRLELYVPGNHRDQLAQHLDEHRAQHPADRLLHMLTGAWTTQALATSAQLHLPDAMSTDTPISADALARQIEADPKNLTTLLRYLVALGALTESPAGYRLTEVGTLLRADAPHSMRPLALMYGGPFYASFAALSHTVRTGEAAFDHLYGTNHFDYFASDSVLAETFDQSMAASTPMFEPLVSHPVITAAAHDTTQRTVVDIAGGSGQLLDLILTAHSRPHAALLERPHVIEAARRTLDVSGNGARCTYHAGDFADVPTGGDVYLLSRVLHDWDDDHCREILRHIRRAMPDHADLLVVERLLPENGTPTLATAWNLHMMCNTGGRERSITHYTRLLNDAALTLVSTSPLPLEGNVLHVRAIV
ncbi:methyltransferase [Streptomyces sp. NPDC018057]|uniref:methyltransferase n=1 Tax=unclassified Streptomyces TaxID=2593676 RepID=UPI0037A034C1